MQLYKVVKELIEFSERNIVIVEGYNDKKVLIELGVKNIVTMDKIYKYLPLYRNKNVLILTDNDKKGRALYKRLREISYAEGIIDNYPLRYKFFKQFRITRVEDLKRKIEKIKNIIDYERSLLSL